MPDMGTPLQALHLLRSCTGVTGEKPNPWPPHPTALFCFEGLSLRHLGQPLVATHAGMANRALVAPSVPACSPGCSHTPALPLGWLWHCQPPWSVPLTNLTPDISLCVCAETANHNAQTSCWGAGRDGNLHAPKSCML